MVIRMEGDIFTCGAGVLIHQANCHHSMASGIAREIKERFPEAYAADLATPKASLEKLGTFSAAEVDRPPDAADGLEVNSGRNGDGIPIPGFRYVVNLYSQYGFTDGNRKTSYDAMYDGLLRVRNDPRFSGLVFAVPYKIGCGLGGGNWKVVTAILEAVFGDRLSEGESQPKLCVFRKSPD